MSCHLSSDSSREYTIVQYDEGEALVVTSNDANDHSNDSEGDIIENNEVENNDQCAKDEVLNVYPQRPSDTSNTINLRDLTIDIPIDSSNFSTMVGEGNIPKLVTHSSLQGLITYK